MRLPPVLRARPEKLLSRAEAVKTSGHFGWGGETWRGREPSPRIPTSMPSRKKELKAYVKRFANRSYKTTFG